MEADRKIPCKVLIYHHRWCATQLPVVLDKIGLKLMMGSTIVELVMCTHKSVAISKDACRTISLHSYVLKVRVPCAFTFIFYNHVMHNYACRHYFTYCLTIPPIRWTTNDCPSSLEYTECSLNLLPGPLLHFTEVSFLLFHGLTYTLHKGRLLRIYTMSQVISHIIIMAVNPEINRDCVSLHVLWEDGRSVQHIYIVAASRHAKSTGYWRPQPPKSW